MTEPANAFAAGLVVREPDIGDATALSGLLGELGYPTAPVDIPQRMSALRETGAIVYVAELAGEVVGVITGHVLRTLHSTPPLAWLTALVVTERARGRGVGRRLVERIEQWAGQRGAARISLTSALHREEAHRFYEGIGYTRSGLRLTKTLRDS